MMIRERDRAIIRSNGRTSSLELHLGRKVFSSGRRLSGVVVFRAGGPVKVRSISVSISGREMPAGASIARSIKRTTVFFQRDLLLTGMEQPRFTSQRMSQFWNAFLGRDCGRTLSAGEHAYPFSIPLPASLPSSYEGSAGRIGYSVVARVQFLSSRNMRVSAEVPVVFTPRPQRGRPVALSYPTADGTVHASAINVSLELSHRAVELGGKIGGRLTINNPQHAPITEALASLESCEWVRLVSEKEMQRSKADSATLTPQDPQAEAMDLRFELRVPADAPPTVEGTAISVIWLLKLSLKTDPPIEIKTPVTIYAPDVSSAPQE